MAGALASAAVVIGTPFRDALAAHEGEFFIPLPELSNSAGLPGKAGGSPTVTLEEPPMPKLDLDGSTVNVRDAGDGLPVILLHSSSSHSGQWKQLSN